MRSLVPLVPALALLTTAFGFGGLWSGASASGALGSLLVWLVLAALGAAHWRDPLRLGARYSAPVALAAAWLPWLVLTISWAVSLVPRAGEWAVLVGPLVILAPAGVVRCWPDEGARRLGLVAVAAVLGLVASWGLLAAFDVVCCAAEDELRVALPLGHHNLQALWLLGVLPIACSLLRDRGWTGWLAGSAVSLAVVAVLLTRSLAGGLGLMVLLIGSWVTLRPRGEDRSADTSEGRFGSRELTLLGVGVLVLAALLPRIVSIATGRDASFGARWDYLQAAIAGLAERPLLGAGPGGSSWLAGQYLDVVSPALVADQVVTDFHSLPLDLSFETGILGLVAMVLLVVFLLWKDGGWARFLLSPLLAASLVAGWFDIAGLYVALTVGVGAVLAERDDEWTPATRWALTPWVALVVVVVAPKLSAHALFDRAVRLAGDPSVSPSQIAQERVRLLEQAQELDPYMPLYRLHLALLEPEPRAAAEHALSGAKAAHGLSSLWLVAGTKLHAAARKTESKAALKQACSLDPRDPFAPLALARQQFPRVVDVNSMSRALLADPRVMTADRLDFQWEMVTAAVHRLENEETIPLGWRASLVSAWRSLDRREVAAGERGRLILELDSSTETSLSLYAFKRRPWRTTVASVDLAAFPALESMPSAFDVADLSRLIDEPCALSAPPRRVDGVPGAR